MLNVLGMGMLVLAGGEVEKGTYTHPHFGVRFAAPEEDFEIRTTGFQYGFYGTGAKAEVESVDGHVSGAFVVWDCYWTVEEYAAWREKTRLDQQGRQGFQKEKEEKFQKQGATWMIREYSTCFEGTSSRHLILYLERGLFNFELSLGVNESLWTTYQDSLYGIVRSVDLVTGVPTLRCSKCGAEGPAGRKFCGECGGSMTAVRRAASCRSCGEKFGGAEKFCLGCGAARPATPKSLTNEQATQMYQEGNQAFDAGRYEEAEEIYTTILEAQPALGNVWISLGASRVLQGRVREAIADYEQALRTGTADAAWAHRNRALAWYHLAEYAKAQQDIQKAMKLRSEYQKSFARFLGRVQDQVKK